MAELTKQEVIDAISSKIVTAKTSNTPLRSLNVDATMDDIKKDAAKIKTKEELNKYLKTGILPKRGFGENVLAQLDGEPYGAAANAPLAGIAFLGGSIGSVKKAVEAGSKLTKAIRTKKVVDATDEAIGAVGGKTRKILTKKNLARTAVLGAAGAWATNALGNIGGGNDNTGDANDPVAIAEQSALQAIVDANNAGVSVMPIIEGPYGKQLGLNANNTLAFAAKNGVDTSGGLVGIGSVGIFTGKRLDKTGPKGVVYKELKPEKVSLAEWKKMFPNPNDATAMKNLKSQFGLDPAASIFQVKDAWEKYGQLSLDYARAGTTISPYELGKLNNGLTGSGGGTTTTIDKSEMAEGDVRTYAKRQLAQSLGLANVDDKMYKDILAIVRKKEAKNPTKTVRTTSGNVTTTKTTPGYGASDVLVDIEEYAKKDPRYAEFQTANVFGQGLTQALGLKA